VYGTLSNIYYFTNVLTVRKIISYTYIVSQFYNDEKDAQHKYNIIIYNIILVE